MLILKNIRLASKTTGVLRLFLCGAALTSVALTQMSQTQPGGEPKKGDIAAAVDRLKQGDVNLADINRIARAGAVQAIPGLKKQFELAQDGLSKDSMASALVRLGDKDPIWWEYVAQQATAAIESDAPCPMGFDLNGKTVPGPSSEFIAWAKVHSLTINAAEEIAVRELPGKVAFLAETRDRRAIPLLQRALSSPNVLIQTRAAQALEEFQDKGSIPLIVGACRRAPADAAAAIANFSLARWGDPDAKNAASEFMPATPPKEAK
ncbi:MAG TPA: HEAT repeat domain-containing protein [Bryobacteraceae bacterium]|jgi:HEAT repeat protein|nr:HEAT repeat domain-containing protein [Bryobacteraceae bacterium]